MIRVDIESIIMAAGPVPSIIVLRERSHDQIGEADRRALSIQTGSFEAAALGRSIEHVESPRPVTHGLMNDIVDKLDATVARVEINDVDAPVFYSTIILSQGGNEEIKVDARPSDALALAVRSRAPIFVEDDVMNRAGSTAVRSAESNEAEFERFDEFVQTLSPEDF